ncbi:hypothetical protein CPLU01_06443 [Colletotrichum plurivorum]|uniref:Uncharacterized protein n=1 Tax=Colletotrichum plurivorum TaxID=2175906 RepID=A0A8H6KJH7_9PEZI|nr:hypothetical protein CPLU01_06443 [Colletotrichum plurivorum]
MSDAVAVAVGSSSIGDAAIGRGDVRVGPIDGLFRQDTADGTRGVESSKPVNVQQRPHPHPMHSLNYRSEPGTLRSSLAEKLSIGSVHPSPPSGCSVDRVGPRIPKEHEKNGETARIPRNDKQDKYSVDVGSYSAHCTDVIHAVDCWLATSIAARLLVASPSPFLSATCQSAPLLHVLALAHLGLSFLVVPAANQH